jgi:FkbM family methyltransferase
VKLGSRLRNLLRFKVEARILGLLAKPGIRVPLSLRGRNWMVPESLLREGDVCYSGGVGEEIDLELWMSQSRGVRVLLLDPTPRSIRFVEGLREQGALPAGVDFLPVGLYRQDETLRFFAPEDPTWVSHSIEEGGDAGRSWFDAPCRRLSSLMKERGDARVDIVKLNIEGAEHAVLESMIEDGVIPRVLLLTFEGRHALSRTLRWVRRLRDAGLLLAGRRAWAFTFIRSDASDHLPAST